MKSKTIDLKLKKELTPKRYQHTLYVMEAAKNLAIRYGSNEKKAVIAAQLHDCVKNFSDEDLLKYVKKHRIKVDKITLSEPQLLHGPVGAAVAKKKYGIKDKEILNAIAYHTTGRKKMSTLEKIIYLADFIEPGRSYPGVDVLRKLAFKDLDQAMIQALSNTIRYVSGVDSLIHPRTVIARNDLMLKKNKINKRK